MVTDVSRILRCFPPSVLLLAIWAATPAQPCLAEDAWVHQSDSFAGDSFTSDSFTSDTGDALQDGSGDAFRSIDVTYEPISLQPAAGNTPPPLQTARLSSVRASRSRLGRAPSMFGSFVNPGSQLLAQLTLVTDGEDEEEEVTSVAFCLASALRRTPLADNGKTLPTDRVFFVYNHFNNALNQSASCLTAPTQSHRASVDRYLIGYEKTCFSEQCSIELRFPFLGMPDAQFGPDPVINVPGAEYGNLNLIGKVLVHRSEDFAAAVGLGIDLPTAPDVTGVVGVPGSLTHFRIYNEAVYLQPFIAALATPTESCFVQSFIQMDIPTIGNTVTIVDPSNGFADLGPLNDTSLLHFNIEFGHWLYDNPAADYLQGIAGVVELHYTTTLQDPDYVLATSGGNSFGIASPFGRQDLLELTAGLHFELGPNTTLRVGGVAPLRQWPDRTFTGELMVHVNHFFR